MDEGKLLKTLRVTKNMLFLSEQLPNANYNTPRRLKQIEKISKTSNNQNPHNNQNNKSGNNNTNSLPNITINTHCVPINEDNKIINSESSQK